MKVFIVLGFFAAIALVNAHNMQAVHQKCQQDPILHVDESVFDELRKYGKASHLPENYGIHMVCMSKGMGIMGQNGRVNEEGVKHLVGYVERDPYKRQAIVSECSVNKRTPEETAPALWSCLVKRNILA